MAAQREPENGSLGHKLLGLVLTDLSVDALDLAAARAMVVDLLAVCEKHGVDPYRRVEF